MVGSLDDRPLDVDHRASWHQMVQMVGVGVRPLSGGSHEHLLGRFGSSQVLPQMDWVLVD